MLQKIDCSRAIAFTWSRIAQAESFILFRWTST